MRPPKINKYQDGTPKKGTSKTDKTVAKEKIKSAIVLNPRETAASVAASNVKTGYEGSGAKTKDRVIPMYNNPDYILEKKLPRTAQWNRFQTFLQNYKLPTGESYVGNEAANRGANSGYTERAIADYNKSLLEKYNPSDAKKLEIGLDDVAQVQEYYYQGDPLIQRDKITGGETSQMRFPFFSTVALDNAKPSEYIPLTYGGKQYVVSGENYNKYLRPLQAGAGDADEVHQYFEPYDPNVHKNINQKYISQVDKLGAVAGGSGTFSPQALLSGKPLPKFTYKAGEGTMEEQLNAYQQEAGIIPKTKKTITAPKTTVSTTNLSVAPETTPTPTVLPTSEEKAPVTIPQNKAKGGSIMAPKMKGYKNGTGPDGLTDQQRNEKYGINNSGVVQVSSGQGQTNTGNVPINQEQLNAKKKKNEALASQLGSAAMTIGSQLNQQPIDYSASEKQRQNADIANVGIDQTLSAVNPYYGLAKGASGILGSMTAKDKYGEAKSGVNAAINEITAMPTERIASEAAKGNALGVLREASGWGKIGRAGMQIIGKGDETKGFFGGVNKALGTTDRKKAGEKYMAEQLAEAKAKDTAYKQEQAVANRDANVLEGAQVQGLYDLSNPEYDENRQLILKPGYAKGGVIGAAKMRYAKGGTIVGKGGPKDDAILTKANKEGIEPGSFIVPAENNEKAKGIRGALFGDKNKVAKFKKGGEMESNVAVSNGEHLFTPKERKKIINYLGEEILEELAPNAEENNESENDKAMGGMIKRADGSYSKRGLWDNIRDAAGSGKKPTAEMLKQEKNIKVGYYNGGIMPEGIASQKRTEQIQDSYKSGGYVVQRSSDREGKTHKVTGPDGTVKYFGDPNLGQHPKDPARKEAFYARHKENLDNNPHFRAYARETWAEGGTTGTMTDRTNMAEYKDGGLTKSKAKIMLHEGMVNGKPITEQQRKYFGWVAGGSKQSKMDGGDINGYAAGGGVDDDNKDRLADFEESIAKFKKRLEKAKSENDQENVERYQKTINALQSSYDYIKQISDGDSKTQPSSITTKPVVGKTETTAVTQPTTATVAVTETKPKVKAPPVKGGKKSKKSSDMTFEPMERRDIALEELRKADEAQAIGKEQSQENVIMTTPMKDVPTTLPTASTTPTSPAAPRKGLEDYVKNIDPGAAFSAYQIGQGSKLLKSGQRPTDVSKIDPAWNAAVERAQREATFGYTPEQAAMLEQQRLNALGDARFSGRNLAGGSAGTAFQQERQAINQGWSNALQLKSADQQLRMQKQQYADQAVRERAAFLDMQRRRAFGDAMDTYNVNQESGSALVGAGVRNAIGAFRYQKELDAQERAAKMAGAPIKTD